MKYGNKKENLGRKWKRNVIYLSSDVGYLTISVVTCKYVHRGRENGMGVGEFVLISLFKINNIVKRSILWPFYIRREGKEEK